MGLLLLLTGAWAAAWGQPVDVPPADPERGPAPARPSAVASPTAATPMPAPAEGSAALTPTPTPLVFENVPVTTLWSQYREAIAAIEAQDPEGVKKFFRLISAEDEKWLEANVDSLADLLSSGTIATSTPAEKRLFVLQAYLRNMPRDVEPKPKFYRVAGSPYALAKVTDSSSGTPVEFLTLLLQEQGRWVLYHPFFARDFVWVPQLAYYKKYRRMPNAPEEQAYLMHGFAPFQNWARGYYELCGYWPGDETRGKTSGSPSGALR